MRKILCSTPLIASWIACVVAPVSTPAQEFANTQSTGPVEVHTSLAPKEPIIGDEITLTIAVRAEKDVEVLMPEFSEALERYSIVAFVPSQKIEDDGSVRLSQTYTLQPHASGAQAIPPILIEFVDHRPGKKPSPDDFDAYEILTDRIDFTVQSVLPSDATNELRPALGTLALVKQQAQTTVWILGAVLLGITALVLAFVIAARMRHRKKRANAYDLARSRLQRILSDRDLPKPRLSIEQFFVEISAVIRRYLENRFELRAPDLTTDEFLQLAAGESDLTNEHQSLLSEFLQQADRVKFAGVQATAQDVRRSSDLAVQFLEETRANAPDVDVQEGSSDEDSRLETKNQSQSLTEEPVNV